MSSTEPHNVNLEALAAQVDALETQARALSATQANGRHVRTALMVIVVLFLGISIYSFYSLGLKLQSKQYLDELMQLAQQRLPSQSQFFAEQTQKLVNTSSPALTQAFSERFRTDLPKFLNAIQSERQQLAENLENRLRSKLSHHYETLVQKHENLFPEEFPLVKDKELHARMIANLQIAIEKLVKKYYIDQLQDQFATMYSTWDDFPIAEATEKDDTPLEDQLVANLLELLTVKLAHRQDFDPAK